MFEKSYQKIEISKTSIDFNKQSYDVIIEEDENQSPSYSIESISNFSRATDKQQNDQKISIKNQSFTELNQKKNSDLFFQKNCQDKISQENKQNNSKVQKDQKIKQNLQFKTLDLFLKKISQEENNTQVQDKTIKKKRVKKKPVNKSRKVSQKKIQKQTSVSIVKNYSQQFSNLKQELKKKNLICPNENQKKKKFSKNNSQQKLEKNNENNFICQSKSQHQKSLLFLKKIMN